ncbi:MAG: alpha/beta fold hydrolase [Saprospiraceae bacterium]
MKIYINHFILLFVGSLFFTQCAKEEFTISESADDFFFLAAEDANLPVQVQGNTASGKMIVMLHGGPGGSSIIFNELFTEFTDELEAKYGVAYYDQRSSGTAQGANDETLLTPEQYVADLEQLTYLLRNKYGDSMQFYLCGLSWGGYLGNAFLSKDNNQDLYDGWINLVGAHDFKQIAHFGREKMLFYGEQQMSLDKNKEDWEEILEYCRENPTVNDKDDFIQMNGRAHRSNQLMKDSLEQTLTVAPLGRQLAFAFTSPFDSNAMLSNRQNIFASELLERIVENPLQEKLPNIKLPSLLIGGNYDFVVPVESLREQYELYSSVDKSFHVLPHSSHTIIGDEIPALIKLMTEFVDRL